MMSSAREQSVDVAIVGATAAGLAAARVLTDAGRQVALIDVRREPAAARSSGVPVGLLTAAWPHEIAVRHGEAAATAYLAQISRASAETLAALRGLGVPADDVPGWGVAIDGHLAFELRHQSRLLRLAGITVGFTDVQPWPTPVRPMLTLGAHALVDRERARARALEALSDRGVGVLRASVEERRADRLRTSAGTLRAPDVIDTVGCAGSGASVVARRLRTVARPVLACAPLVWASGDADGPVRCVARWVDGPADLLAASETGAFVLGRPGGDAARLEEWARVVLGAQLVGREVRWSEESPDALPVAGPLPGHRGTWVARGAGVADLSVGCWAGVTVARQLLGEDDARVASPLRGAAEAVAPLRRRLGVLADPKQRVAETLVARGLSRAVSERRP